MTIKEILEAHERWEYADVDGEFLDWTIKCEGCEWTAKNVGDGNKENHRAHVAEVLDKHMLSVVSETQEHAWDEGYGDCWDFHRSAGMIGRETNPYRKEPANGR